MNLPLSPGFFPRLEPSENDMQKWQESSDVLLKHLRSKLHSSSWQKLPCRNGIDLQKTNNIKKKQTSIVLCGNVYVAGTVSEVLDLFSITTTDAYRKTMASLYGNSPLLDAVCLFAMQPRMGKSMQCSVKWNAFEIDGEGGEDYCLMECTGLKSSKDDDDTSWGYCIQHSVTRKEVPDLQSMCSLTRSFLEGMGIIIEPSLRPNMVRVSMVCQIEAPEASTTLSGRKRSLLTSTTRTSGHEDRMLSRMSTLLKNLIPTLERIRLSKMHFVHRLQWVPNAKRKCCAMCSKSFTMRKKHHCRQCGEVVCSKCAPLRDIDLNSIGISKLRICTGCVVKARSIHTTIVKRNTSTRTSGGTARKDDSELTRQNGFYEEIISPSPPSLMKSNNSSITSSSSTSSTKSTKEYVDIANTIVTSESNDDYVRFSAILRRATTVPEVARNSFLKDTFLEISESFLEVEENEETLSIGERISIEENVQEEKEEDEPLFPDLMGTLHERLASIKHKLDDNKTSIKNAHKPQDFIIQEDEKLSPVASKGRLSHLSNDSTPRSTTSSIEDITMAEIQALRMQAEAPQNEKDAHATRELLVKSIGQVERQVQFWERQSQASAEKIYNQEDEKPEEDERTLLQSSYSTRHKICFKSMVDELHEIMGLPTISSATVAMATKSAAVAKKAAVTKAVATKKATVTRRASPPEVVELQEVAAESSAMNRTRRSDSNTSNSSVESFVSNASDVENYRQAAELFLYRSTKTDEKNFIEKDEIAEKEEEPIVEIVQEPNNSLKTTKLSEPRKQPRDAPLLQSHVQQHMRQLWSRNLTKATSIIQQALMTMVNVLTVVLQLGLQSEFTVLKRSDSLYASVLLNVLGSDDLLKLAGYLSFPKKLILQEIEIDRIQCVLSVLEAELERVHNTTDLPVEFSM